MRLRNASVKYIASKSGMLQNKCTLVSKNCHQESTSDSLFLVVDEQEKQKEKNFPTEPGRLKSIAVLKWIFKKIVNNKADWIQLAEFRVRWRFLVHKVIGMWSRSVWRGNFLTS